MSTVMRPRGPLPARVYWVRRLLAACVVLLLVVLVWWLAPGGGRSTPAAARPASGDQAAGGTSGTSVQQANPTQTSRTGQASHPVSTGDCDATRLVMSLRTGEAVEGRGTRIGVLLSTGSDTTCDLGITPARLVIEIAKDDGSIVWASANCPDELPVRNVTVGPQPTIVYSFRWDGHVDGHACRAGRIAPASAQPYTVTAAFIGGEPVHAALQVIPATTA